MTHVTDRDPDDLTGDAPVFTLLIKVRKNGAMSVEGDIYQQKYAIMVLDAAAQSIKSHNARRKIENGGLVIPSHDMPTLGG